MARTNRLLLSKGSLSPLAKPNLHDTSSLQTRQPEKLALKNQERKIQEKEKREMPYLLFENDCERNSWITPGYDSMQMLTELIHQVNGSGGPIDQLNLYIDLKSALDWQSISNNEDYITASHDIPLDDAVNAIKHQLEFSSHLEQRSLDIISLGPGNAHTEVKLIKKILKQTSIQYIRLYLLDISQPLSNNAHKYVTSVFAEEPNVEVTPVSGNFYKLSQYQKLLSISKKANHLLLVTMLGYTFGNLENERRFVINSLNAFPPQTLFLFDLGLVFAPADQKEEIKKKDPWLSGHSRWQEPIEKWITGPLRRYRSNLKNEDLIRLDASLDYSRCVIPKSYCVELAAILPDKAKFCLLHFKRYDQVSLAKCMREDGWDSLDAWYYSENKGLLQLSRRQ